MIALILPCSALVQRAHEHYHSDFHHSQQHASQPNLGTSKAMNGEEYSDDDFEKDDLVNIEPTAPKKDLAQKKNRQLDAENLSRSTEIE